MTRELQRAFRFFQKNAGYIVGEHAKCSLDLARAERDAEDAGIFFESEQDEFPDLSWMTEKEREQEHEVIGIVAYRICPVCGNKEHLASLWGITDADKNYLRVVKAELAGEALTYLEKTHCA